MPAQRDYYETLGVDRKADEAEIKKAFRRLAMKHHPDRNTGDKASEEKFKEIKEAYEVLSDSQKRAAYDRFGHEGVKQTGGFGAGGFNFDDIFGDIGDIFGDIFGGSRRGGGSRQAQGYPGSDLRYELTITLEEAVRGTKKRIEIPTLVKCEVCAGSGAAKGSGPIPCKECDGTGQVRMQQGFFSIQQTCPYCHGTGRIIKDPCTACHGEGRKRQKKTLSVKVPAGVDNGDRIRLSGEGEAGAQGGSAGDLYVDIRVKPHSIFTRKGVDLYCEVPVNFSVLALGGSIDVPTLEGSMKIKIPTETQTGKVFRLRGKGIKSIRGGATGDILCCVIVETPVRLSKKQKALLEQFDSSLKEDKANHSPNAESWFDKVKHFFEDLAGSTEEEGS